MESKIELKSGFKKIFKIIQNFKWILSAAEKILIKISDILKYYLNKIIAIQKGKENESISEKQFS